MRIPERVLERRHDHFLKTHNIAETLHTLFSRTMERSAVGLVYDIVAVPLTKHKRDAEELRVQCLGVVKIWDGKLAQSDIVRCFPSPFS